MKPAWPMENWPVKPFTTLSETARMTLMPAIMRMIWADLEVSSWPFTSQSTGRASRNGSSERKTSLRVPTLNLLRANAPEEPGRAEEQDQDQHREGDAVAVGRERVAGDVLLGQAEDQAAHHGAGHVADAAEHRGHEGLDAGHEPHERVDGGARAGHQQRRRGGEAAAEREGPGDDAVH